MSEPRPPRLAAWIAARSIRIDDTGVGGGVTDRLFELQGEATAPLALRPQQV